MKSGWTVLPFDEVFDDVSGGNRKILQSAYLPEGNLPVIDQGKSFVAGYVNELDVACKTPPPVIVFGDHTKCFKYIDFPFAMGADGIKVLKPKLKSDPKYLFYHLRRLNIPDTGYDRHFKYLKRAQITLPPLDEQRRIVAILDTADKMRELRRQIIAKLDTLLKGVFLEMFGHSVTNPKGWPVIKLGDCIINGPQNGLYKPSSDYGEGTPILRIDSFYDGVISGMDKLKRVRLNESERNLYSLDENDIVINRVNSLSHLGKSAIVPKLSEATVFESNMMRMSFDTSRFHPIFIIQYLQSNHIKSQIMNCAKNAVNQSSINQTDVKGFRIFEPSIELQ